ncbi:RHO GTPase-activating protein RGD1 [Paramyrothecium foliicola]|nr:RHO GTPase-activating protein RGD1 [Paramyrothecium foliicola]
MTDYHPTRQGSPPPQLPHLQSPDAPPGSSLGADVEHPQPPEKDELHDSTIHQIPGDVDGHAAEPISTTPPLQTQQATISPEVAKQVNDVLGSEIGIATLLNRLKQSIASTKEFALFLKKRSQLEDDQAQSLKKHCRITQENMRRADHRQGSFSQIYDEMMYMQERMAENGIQFASSLHQMHDDLLELAAVAERSRKGWKANGLAAEQKVADLEQAMRKSKTKYDSLADEYDRARTGELKQSGKVFGAFKNKSAAQQEEELQKKVQAADQVYHNHVQTLQAEKAQLQATIRPEAIKALQELIRETDSGLTLQMQKFAAFNEKLLLSNGLIISPLRGPGAESQPRSLRQAVASINNDKDLNDYVASHHLKMAPNTGEVKYERHPVLGGNPAQSHSVNASIQSVPQFPTQSESMSSRTGTFNYGSPPNNPQPPQGPPQFNQGFPQPGPPQGQPPAQFPTHDRAPSQGTLPSLQTAAPPQYGVTSATSQLPSHTRYGNGGSISSSQGPPQLGALSFQGPGSPIQVSAPQLPHPQYQPQEPTGPGPAAQQSYLPSQHSPPPPLAQQGHTPPPSGPPSQNKPAFGVPLNRLYERDNLAVPMVVHQCIQAVELYGLNVEGIYRQSGSMAHIQKLKSMFDTDSTNPALDFRVPDNFFHDVNSVTGLLKQFFRDLPDPLLTMEHHDSLIAAAKRDDDIVRRDSLHAIINSLPDPNYATLRALTLHLYRIMDKAHINRMNSHNLAVIFGPTLMGSDPSTAIADAGWQIRVIDTILQNTYQIFDED